MKLSDLKDKIHMEKIKENIPTDKINEVIANAESKAKEELEKRYNQAKEILDDDEKVDNFLENTEKKLKTVQALNTRYLTEIQEYKVSIETLKCQMQGEK